jgi:hypothetical protein
MNLRKSTLLGGAIGLADGLAFVTCFHTGLDVLTPILIWPALPGWWVARFVSDWVPKGIAWSLGVLALALLGALVGGAVGLLFRRIRTGESRI